jgi:hypothetical protein
MARPYWRGTRARFVASDVPPADGIFGGAHIGDRGHMSLKAAAREGKAWVYRAEKAATQVKGQPVQWEVVGAMHVYDDGTLMPVGIVNPKATAWARPSGAKAAVSAAAGFAVMGGSAYLASRLPLPNPEFDPVTVSNIGTALRAAIKYSRFKGAGRWHGRYVQMTANAGARGEFDQSLGALSALGPGNGSRADMANAVAAFRRNERWAAGQFAANRRTTLAPLLDQLGAHAKELGLEREAAPMIAALRGALKGKTVFDRRLELHERLANRLDASRRARFLAGMKPADRQAFGSQVADIRQVLADGPGGDPAGFQDRLDAAVGKTYVASKLRNADSPVRKTIDLVQATTYTAALAFELHYPQFDSWRSILANGGFDGAFLADGVRIAGTRIGDKLFKVPEGAPKVSDNRFFTRVLPVADDTLTTAGGFGTFGNALHDWLGKNSFQAEFHGIPTVRLAGDQATRHFLRLGVSAWYTRTAGKAWVNAFRRRWADPSIEDAGARKTHLGLKVAGGVAAGVLVLDSAYQHWEDAKKKQQPGGTPVPLPTPTPGAATPTTGSTPQPVPSHAPSRSHAPKPTRTAAPHAGSPMPTPTSTSMPPPRHPHAQVIVDRDDPRRATLWGIANASAVDLQGGAAVTTAPVDGEASAALRQLFQVDPQRRGFSGV